MYFLSLFVLFKIKMQKRKNYERLMFHDDIRKI